MPEPNFNNPTVAALSSDNQVRIVLAAYQKHATELLAIEASQERLNSLVLGIYSAGLTLIAGFLKDAQRLLQTPAHVPTPFAWMLILVAAVIGVYAVYMSTRRNNARHAVRQGLVRIDQALGFFKPGTYLQNQPLFPAEWLAFDNPGFLDWSHLIVGVGGIAFMAAVYFIAVG